jgi:hypothetical protein
MDMVFCHYEVTAFMRGYLEGACAHGCSTVVCRHPDPDRVWIVTLDSDRHDLWQDLGIQVGDVVEFPFYVRIAERSYPWTIHVFTCERLNHPKSLDRYDLLATQWEELDAYYGMDCIPLPQPEPELQSLVYAMYTYGLDWPDWGSHNVLVRSDGTLFLSDVLCTHAHMGWCSVWVSIHTIEAIDQYIGRERREYCEYHRQRPAAPVCAAIPAGSVAE